VPSQRNLSIRCPRHGVSGRFSLSLITGATTIMARPIPITVAAVVVLTLDGSHPYLLRFFLLA